MSWGFAEHISHVKKLLEPGVIGNYKSFEVTEVFGFHLDTPKQPINFMSLLVAEPSSPPDGDPAPPNLLTDKPIELRGTPWKFGAARYRVSTKQVLRALQDLESIGEWRPGAYALKVGTLTPIPPQFVPADTTDPHPWNGVLKNNFWEGSHVLEMFDGQKTDVSFLLVDPQLLKKLAVGIMPFVKMGIDGLSDRIGNVLIQFPVTVVTTKISSSVNGDFLAQPIWRSDTPTRQLRVSCEKYEDTTVEGFYSEDVTASLATFPLHSPGGGARYILWDDEHKLVLGASAQTAFITSITMNFDIVWGSGSTRDFYRPSGNGTAELVSVPLIEERTPSTIGRPTSNPREPWRENRVFRDSLKNIRARKEFIQYGGNSGAGTDDALKDLRTLLRLHGRTGAWLWDPYLDANDIVATLFHCPHKGADLRALTAGAEPPATKDKANSPEAMALCRKVATWLRSYPLAGWLGLNSSSAPPPSQSWRDKQLLTFKESKVNDKDLQLEFRIREGNAGWPFHDRFLVFPSDTGPALAWSLGTSVNSFGQKHHILQKVADGELIRQAFLDLWDELNGSEFRVWSTS